MNRKKPWSPTWSDDHGAWIVDFRVSGRRVRRRLPIRDPGLKSIAEKEAIETYRSAWESAGESNADKSKMTFHEAAELYVAQGGEERFLSRILKYIGPKVLVDDIRPADVARAAKILYRDAKPETVRRQLHVPIKAVQNFAAGRRRSKIPDTRRTRWLTPEEAERLLTAAAYPERIGLRDPNRETLRKIAFMLGTWASPGETMPARVENWNPATREWWLSGTRTVYRARYARLPTRAVELIGKILEEGPAFPAPNGMPYKFTKNRGGQMAVAFRKIRDAAGLDEFICPYSCRHSWATWHHKQVKDWGELLDRGGWHKSDTANRYRKIAPDDLGERLLAHGWDFRADRGSPVKFGELVHLRFEETGDTE